MSINAIHADMMKNLESAMDMGKFLGVFNTLIGVIKDQQNKIDELNAKSEKMASQIADYAKRPAIQHAPAPAPSAAPDRGESAGPSNELLQALEDKVNALETKLNDTLLELHGLGEDNSILDREEEPPEFLALPNSNKNEVGFHFTPSSRFVATAAPITEAEGEKESDDDSTAGFSPRSNPSVSPGGSKRPSMRSRAGEDAEEATPPEPEDAEVAAATEQQGSRAETPANEPAEETKSELAISEAAAPSAGVSAVQSRQPTAPASPQRSTQASPLLSAHVSKPPSPVPGGTDLVVEVPVARSRGASPSPVQPSPQRISPAPGLPPALPAALPVPAYSPQRSKTEIAKDLAGAHAPLHHMPSVGSVTAQARAGLLTVTPMELRPSTMRESFSTKLQQLESELFPIGKEELVSTPDAAVVKAHRRASFVSGPDPGSSKKAHPHLHRRLQQHYHKYHVDAVLPYERLVALAEYRDIRSHDHKDKMDAKNLKLVTPEMRAKLVRMLKQKGRFIHISRNMLEESRQKYAARSLKQNVEYVEAETRRLFNKVAQIRDHLKRQHLTMRYMLPMDFHETFDRLVDFLENLETKGGVEEIMALPPASSILAYDQQGNLPKSMLDAIIAKIKPLIAQEVAGVKTQMQTLKEEGLTVAQFAEIMQPETDESGGSGANRKNSSVNAFSKEKELARRRTMDLIKGCISQERKAQEDALAKQKELEDAELAGKTTVSTLIHGLSNSPRQDSSHGRRPKTPSMILIQERSDTANRTYVDDKVRELEEQLSHLRLTVDASKDTSVNDMAFLTAKLDALEVASENMQRHDAETREQRKKDSEALKIMQKRLAAVSVDNVMDELKVLQLQVNDRPSTSDVSNMMEGISHTFRKHLGENVVGLRGLVDQVYRQIHHKVNREDIKKLISAKLSQMEQDILRREEEMFSAASSTRCMSCGQLPPDPTNAFVNHAAARRAGSANHSHAQAQRDIGAAEGMKMQQTGHPTAPFRGTTGAGLLRPATRPSTSPQASESAKYAPFNPTDPSSSALQFNPDGEDGQAGVDPVHVALPGMSTVRGELMDDEISLHSEHSMNNNGPSLHPLSLHSSQSGTLGPVRSEEIYSVLTGSAGLKSLMPQHTPMIPVRDPYGISTNAIHGNSTAAPTGQAKRRQQVPEPMYRKAKMAAHIKEMVKVSAPSAQNYGFNSTNPFFVMDGYADDVDPHLSVDGGSSLLSKGRRPRTQGSVQGVSLQQQQQQQVYVPIPRSSMNPNSATNHILLSASTGAVVNDRGDNVSVSTVLPQISNKTPRQVV